MWTIGNFQTFLIGRAESYIYNLFQIIHQRYFASSPSERRK